MDGTDKDNAVTNLGYYTSITFAATESEVLLGFYFLRILPAEGYAAIALHPL